MLGIHEAHRLLAQNTLLELVVEERIGDVQLLGLPAPGSCNGEHCANGARLHNWSKCLTEIDAGALSKDMDDPATFVSLQVAIGVGLVFEHPLAGDNICARQSVD